MTTLLSFLAFLVIGSLVFGRDAVGPIAIAVAVHEAGHWAAMRCFGIRGARVVFLPGLGGVTFGPGVLNEGWKRAVVLLAGPSPGLLAVYILFLVGVPLDGEWSSIGIAMLFVNALNLLPVFPLDGGRLVEEIVIGRWPRLVPSFRLGTVLLAGVFAAALGDWVWAILAMAVAGLLVWGHLEPEGLVPTRSRPPGVLASAALVGAYLGTAVPGLLVWWLVIVGRL